MSSEKRSNKDMNSESTSRLQLESQRMEDRLRILKQMMSIEKRQREASNGQNSHWKSGQRGPLTTKRPSDINTTEKRTATKSHKSVKIKVLTGKEPEETQQNSYRVQCGQCELYQASMVCVECVENYCNVCFAKFHQKGSLSKHHVRPLSRVLVKECPKPTLTNTQSTGSSQDNTSSNSLLTGTYDEAASAESFQVALRAWRTSNKEQNTTTNKDVSSITTTSCGVQASSSTTSTGTKPVNITFSTSPTKASYFDRILLKKLKSNPSFLEPHTNKKKLTRSPVVEDDEDFETTTKSTVSPYNIFYSNKNNTQDTGYNISSTEDRYDELGQHYNGSLILPPRSQQSSNVTIENALLTEHNSLCQDSNVSKVNEEVTSQPSISLTRATTTVTNTVSSAKKTSHKSIKKSKSLKTPKKSKGNSNTALSSETTDLLMSTSIQQAWRECSQLKYTTNTPHDLSCFFLTSVNKQSSLNDVPSHTKTHDTITEWNTNTLSSTLWLPSSSIMEESDKMTSQEDSQSQFDISHSDLPPPTSSTSNFPSTRHLELVASETDSDDNEVFLSDSEEEREKEDESALEDLAWELASLCDNESVRETVINVEEEERVWSCLTMDELIHDFEQFQDKVREEDNL